MNDVPTIDVMYTCHDCGLVDRVVDGVAERGEKEGVVTWMEYVRAQVAIDHANTSPRCRSQKCDLKIPLAAGDARLGAVTRQ